MREDVWIAAQYEFASTYVCGMPMSSPVAAQALPTPGPATVRLALIRNGVELFGETYTRETLFPSIRAMTIRIQPPERVAISRQLLKLYKGSSVNGHAGLQAGLGYREVATADGRLVIYLKVEKRVVRAISECLYAVGAWGSGDSLAYCETVTEAEPPEEIVVVPLQKVSSEKTLRERFIRLATEFRDHQVTWEEVVVGERRGAPDALVPSLWAWPLTICERRSNGMTLRRHSHLNTA